MRRPEPLQDDTNLARLLKSRPQNAKLLSQPDRRQHLPDVKKLVNYILVFCGNEDWSLVIHGRGHYNRPFEDELLARLLSLRRSELGEWDDVALSIPNPDRETELGPLLLIALIADWCVTGLSEPSGRIIWIDQDQVVLTGSLAEQDPELGSENP